jgi:hypothetical protein
MTSDKSCAVQNGELEEEKKPADSEPPRIRCPMGGWSPRKEDKWVCTCGSGTRSRREAFALPACTSGLKLSAFPAPGGRRIRSGIPNKLPCNGRGFGIEGL